MSRPVAILIAGEPIESVKMSRGSYADMMRKVAGSLPLAFADHDIRTGASLPEPETFSAVVVTGSSASVTDRADWVLAGEAYLLRAVAASVPVFGVCFGHQMLGQALGGLVEKNPRGREIGTVSLELIADDPIFDAARAPLRANATHVDTITRLPPGAVALARTALEANAAVRFNETTWGVQFHPEMDGAIVRAYVEARRAILAGEGLDPEALLAQIDDGLTGASTLKRFFTSLATR
ncbi:MAG TPA: glutamine amidotransferase [Polyangiaceae bacterium]|jgi:GMP synthase (glutamine-hydrolysing)|nr:glutamine amidotransferase [Polyangiaceae bacterium]